MHATNNVWPVPHCYHFAYQVKRQCGCFRHAPYRSRWKKAV